MTDAASPPTREQAIALLKRGFDKALQMVAAQYVMPICWISAENGRPLILGNGSAFMVDPGGGPFLVTAHHVYEEFCAARAARADTVCLPDDLTKFPLDQRLIASDPVYDVATFRVTAREIELLKRSGKFVLTGSQATWPPNPPEVERGVFFIGLPGDGRQMRPYRSAGLVEIDWTGYTALAIRHWLLPRV
jgi:hypothetical protein